MSQPLVRNAREIARWDAQADVVIAGFGAAGATAAIEARAAGADVIVVERAGAGGGSAANSGGVIYLGGGTPTQKACGFEDTPEEMFKYLMAACGPSPDEGLVSAYCDGSLEHYAWLVDRGIRFRPRFAAAELGADECPGLVYSGTENAWPFNEIARPAPRGHYSADQGLASGGVLMQTLTQAAMKAGAAVHANTRCLALVVESDGRICGVVVRAAGEQSAVRARGGVILTTGGFISNREMLARHAPWLLPCTNVVGIEGDDGGGLMMGQAAGGVLCRMDAADISLPIYPPLQLRKGILINRHGQRFINEDAYMGRLGEFALLHQQGRVFLVVDDAIFARPEYLEADIAAVGETIAELEADLPLPSGALQATLSFYNEHAAKGRDPLFRKKAEYLAPLAQPPLAALDLSVDVVPYGVLTLGGLQIDTAGAVLDRDGDPIPGLYAAGRTTSGVCKGGYSSGLSIGDSTFFGRRAGRSAAARAIREREARPG
jgi:3-oxo-5alpha-steroid 4-dehydrogenase